MNISGKQIKAVILPAEHGSWSFWLEPVLLGLLLAPSWATVWLALSATAVFLLRQPLKLWLQAWRNGRFTPKTSLAQRFAFLLGSLALLSFAVAYWLIPSRSFLLPLLLAAPFAVVALAYDLARPRTWQAELSAPIALTAVLPAMLLAASWPLAAALAYWGILIAHAITSILYVRGYLRRLKGKPFGMWGITAVHLLALLSCFLLASYIPTPVLYFFLFFLLRALLMLSPILPPQPARVVGIMEMGLGLLLVGLLAT